MGAMMPAQHAISRDRSEPQAMSPARRPRVASPDALLGNQARLRRLTAAPVALQAKLIVGTVDDPLEREADAVADQTMRMADPAFSLTRGSPTVSRKCTACEEEEGKTLQTKPIGPAKPAGGEAPSIVHDVMGSPGQPLDPAARSFFEPRFGFDFSAVRIHTGSRATESARTVSAQAYTVGVNIAFADGYYVPNTESGRHLLAHELAHVVQQSRTSVASGVSARFGLSSATRQLQRAYVEDGAAGCGVCESPQESGRRAHRIIQGTFLGGGVLIGQPLRTLMAEVGIANPESPSGGILDLARIISSPSPPFETMIEIGEIKPFNAKGVKDGVRDLNEYKFELEHSQVIAGVGRSQVLVGFLDLPVPSGVLAFLDPTSKCGEQGLTVDGPDMGLYLYSCTPQRSQFPKEKCCNGEEVPIPFPVGVPEEKKQDSTEQSPAPVQTPVHPQPVAARSTTDRVF